MLPCGMVHQLSINPKAKAHTAASQAALREIGWGWGFPSLTWERIRDDGDCDDTDEEYNRVKTFARHFSTSGFDHSLQVTTISTHFANKAQMEIS